MYDISTSTVYNITANESDQYDPAIYGDRIVWVDGRNGKGDVYMFTINTPENYLVEELKHLKGCVDSLDLHPSVRNAFDTRLKNAICSLEKGDKDKAMKQLESFVECVSFMEEKGKIENKEAEYIVSETQRIINPVNSS